MHAFSSTKYRLACTICIGSILLSLLCCDSPTSSPSKPTVEPSYAEVLETSAAARLNNLGDSSRSVGNYPAAISFYQQSMDSAAVYADSFPYYDSMLDLACVYDRLSELDKAIQIGEVVVAAYIRSQDSSRIGRGYSTLSAFYGRANRIDKQIITAKKGLEIIKQHGDLIECCAAYNQIAFTYTDQKRWAEALPMLDSALILMQASKVLDQLSSIYLNFGNCYRNLQNWDKAKFYLQKSADLADSLNQTHIKSVATLRLSQVAEAQGDYSSALLLFKQSAALKDSVLNKEKMEHLQALEVNYQTREKELLISSLQMERQAASARRNLVFALAFLALAILGFWLFQVRQNLYNSRQTLKKYQQEFKAFIALLHSKNTQLTELENALHKKNRNTTLQPKSSEEDTLEMDLSADGLEGLFNSRILTFQDWETFKYRFELAYPGYLLHMRTTHPDLSGAEERLFLLIKLGFNSQEIADTLGISANGVKKGRQRLRKRLNLRTEEDLDRSIMAF